MSVPPRRRSLPLFQGDAPARVEATPRRVGATARAATRCCWSTPHGLLGVFIVHMPLALLYAAVELVKHEVDVEILDLRLHPDTWEAELRRRIDHETLMVGVSVMTRAAHRRRHRDRPAGEVHRPRGAGGVGRAARDLRLPATVFDEPSVDHAIASYGGVRSTASSRRCSPTRPPTTSRGCGRAAGARWCTGPS
ncbi:MAG: hypothetical protein U0325_34670 [Polyangiales bacterium]